MKLSITLDTDSINQNNSLWDIQNLNFDYFEELKYFYSTCVDKKLPVTTFVRIDEQIKSEFGEYCHVYHQTNALIESVGLIHEFGWHPHVFHLNEGIWSQVIEEQYIVEQLKNIHVACGVIGSMQGVRVGGAQGSSRILSLLNDLGFEYDSSCLSGCKRQDSCRWYDWSTSPNSVFYPSNQDYKRNGQDCIGIKEIPITTMLCLASYDQRPKRRAFNPCYRPEIWRSGVEQFIDSSADEGMIIVSFHAEELKQGYVDDLFNYGISNFWSNMDFLLNLFPISDNQYQLMKHI